MPWSAGSGTWGTKERAMIAIKLSYGHWVPSEVTSACALQLSWDIVGTK